MAANDYYNTRPHDNNAYPPHYEDGDMSKPSQHNPHSYDISPVTSPFDDRNDHYNQRPTHTPSFHTTDSAYHGGGNPYSHTQYNNSTDPFADQNAIPLQPSSSQQPLTAKHSTGRDGLDPENQRSRRKGKSRKKDGWFTGKITWVCFALTIAQIAVFIAELIKNAALTGSPIMIKPTFNFLIGPSPGVMITMGSRYTPCMHNVRGLTDAPSNLVNGNNFVPFFCPNMTDYNQLPICDISEACGFGGLNVQPIGTKFSDRSQEPNQWWRFITPIFLHGGLIHIAFNMLLQLTLGRDMEKQVGSIRFTLVYFSSGIFGSVLGGNYAPPLVSSVGASGSLFGIIGLTLLDLLYTWKERRSPMKDFLFLMIDIIIMLILGFLPFLDNFSHIGGLLMGLVSGVCILHTPNALRERTGIDEPPYAVVGRNGGENTGIVAFIRQPIGFFKGRKPLWWAWWLARAIALTIVLIGFILLLDNFYNVRKECEWCKKLCIPIKNWCDQDRTLPIPYENVTTPARRDLFTFDAEFASFLS